uniref:DUF1731 domain-containing protein n=1 Tax=Rhodosorus marinus TaxID=101924 RepID=A0A7S2ZLM4_9RHOD|mmetsp:Transcript_23407/g.92976  ORF Transcript_23407/g.92976 Transcript_23407/m.92976 type:complete len:357 (+) Transcript_23407:45-1115(+)
MIGFVVGGIRSGRRVRSELNEGRAFFGVRTGSGLEARRCGRSQLTMVTAGGLSKVVVAGGSGFLGKFITRQLVKDGCDEVVVLSRSGKSSEVKAVTSEAWDPKDLDGDWVNVLNGADAVINLCGELIIQPWTAAAKEKITTSRLESTRALVQAMSQIDVVENRPRVFVSSSAVGIYGISDTKEFSESSPAGKDFLADLCVKWEAEAQKANDLAIRTVIMRNGIILGRGGGALGVMLPVFSFALGGTLGSGSQWVSWVTATDAAAAFVKAAESSAMVGAYNVTAPEPCSSKQMSDSLAAALGRPALFPAPAFAIKAVLGEGSTVLLDGQKVLPERLLADGFEFTSTNIADAMKAIVK